MKSKLHHTSPNTSGINIAPESHSVHGRAKEISFILFLLTILAVSVQRLDAQVVSSGNLSTYVDSFISSMPSTYANNDYQAPSASNLNTWGNAITYIMQGNYASAQSAADSIGYRVVAYTNTATSPNNLFYVLEKKSTSTNYWGMFIYNPSATRKKLFIQSPHPKYDSYSGKQGFYIFLNLGCRAFYISGTHRCNSSSSSPCDGTSQVCTGSDDPYRLSDQAHNESTLQRATEIFFANVANMIFVQPHGFGQDTGDPDAIMSNGTRCTPSPYYITILKNNLYAIDTSLTFKLAHIDLTWNSLVATDNTQGRLINGSSDPCETAASVASGRFLHVEQALKLRDTDADRKKLSDALALTFPVYASVGSGDWNSPDTWMAGVIPDSTSDVKIHAGHTITVTGTSYCKSVTFGGTAAKISMQSGVLNVYGDFTLASTSHQAFSSWVTGAKIRFTGSASTQTLSGWSTSAFSTGFNEVVVDKTAGKVVTGGTGMRFQLGTTLDVVGGTFELAATDAIEGRNYAGTAAAPNIIVESGAVFNMAQTSSATGSFIRKASNTADETSKIGSLTVYGSAYLASSVSKGINFTGMIIGSGGLVQFPISRGVAASSVNPGAITINSGGTLKNSVTTSLWYSNSTTPASITINSGGVYEISSSSTTLPSGGITQNSGSAITFSSDLSTTLPSGIATYKTLILSGAGTKSFAVNTTITEALQLSGSFTTLSLGSYTLTYNSSAKLRYGASGQTTAQTTTNNEWPASSGPQNVEIYNSGGVTLHAARTISGVLTLSGGLFFIGDNTLTLGSASSISGTPDATKMIVTNGTGKVVKSILNGATLPYSFTFPIGDSTGTSDYSPVAVSLTSGTFSSASIGALVVNSKHPQNTSSSDYIKRYWTLTASGITSPQYTAVCSYVTGDVVGTESNLTGGLYSSSAWTALGAVSSHSITATSKSSFGDITAGKFSTTGYVQVKVIPQGFYNVGDYLNTKDTLKLLLASPTPPYSFVDSSSTLLDSTTFYATGTFNKASTGSYYLVVKHRNSVETWSAGTISFVQSSTVTYDFTDLQTRAYGDNLTQVNSSPVRWALFSGDVNQDGYVDPLDLSLVDVDSYNYVAGRGLATDINGDGYVDPLDLSITDANSYNYVGIKRPASSKLIDFYMSRRFKNIYDSAK